ncbi:MAG: NAD(P)/FAD-dependent oxidoreductase [Eubacteriales bacterium]|nr:NAD(P)/FAD-dependent oxidoreductase [Eubacteriales bacterium]
MMAALTAAERGCSVTLLEKNEKLGKKIYITGKGRCNYTNACDFNTFIGNVVSNPKFMYSSLRAFMPEDVTELLEEAGCRTKVERGNRAFPLSDHASDVTAALQRRMKAAGVRIELNTEVSEIERIDELYKVAARSLRDGKRAIYSADRLIIATGGVSYPSTGSTGDGYAFAEGFGIKTTERRPALVPFDVAELEDCRRLQGVSLKNVSIRLKLDSGKCIHESESGEMLFTHFGVSGPLILSASSLAAAYIDGSTKLKLEIDLKPALSVEQLDARILRDFEASMNADIHNALSKLLISSLRPIVLERAGIDPYKKVRDISKKERAALANAVKALSFTISGTRGFNEAIITHGGVSVKEIDPKTMEVRKQPGLYFAGEVLDVDAFTGGFNLQIAWSTGRAAGNAAAD